MSFLHSRRKRRSRRVRRSRLLAESLEPRRLLASTDAFGYWSLDSAGSKDAGHEKNDYEIADGISRFPDSDRGRAIQLGPTLSAPVFPGGIFPGEAVTPKASNVSVAAWFRPDNVDDGGSF